MPNQIIEQLNKYPEGKVLFEMPVTVKDVCVIHGAWAGALRTLWLLDWGGRWHELEETDTNYEAVAKAVIEKINPVSSFADAYGDAM